MQETGIVRRIDELGRVVIPKEMRKTLRIREGDPLEIYTEKDNLVFKKYSPIISITDYAKIVADGIEDLTQKTCIITDTDNVIYISKTKLKDCVGKTISNDVVEVLNNRKSVILSRLDGGAIIPVCKDCLLTIENQIIVPIISNGDCFGAVMLIDEDKSSRFNVSDLKIIQLGAWFLSKQLGWFLSP